MDCAWISTERLFIYFIALIFIYIPQKLFITVYFVICLKYGIYLRQLKHDIIDENCKLTMIQIQRKYQSLYESAKSNDGL